MTEYERLKKLVEDAWYERYGYYVSMDDTQLISAPGYWQMKELCDISNCSEPLHKFALYRQTPVRHHLRYKDLIVEVDQDNFSSDVPYSKIETTETWRRLWELKHGQ